MEESKLNLLKATIWIGLLSTILSLFGPNPLLCIPAFISLYCIIRNLFISEYLSAFFIAFLYQWSQVCIKVLYATFTSKDIRLLTKFPEHIVEAYVLSTIALVVVSYGISIYLRKINIDEIEIENSLSKLYFKKNLITYFFMGIITEGSRMLPGFSQFSVMIAGFKWCIFYLIFLYCFTQRKYKTILYIIIGYEICIGFFSYFASWKTVIFYILISLFSILQFRMRHFIGLFIGSCFVLYIALAWTGVKGDYRSFLSGGGQQVVVVSSSDAYRKLFGLMSNFQISDKVQKAFLDRISYIDYFSSCLAYVPEKRPHEAGKLSIQAVEHILKPRLFFPNKAIIDESSHLTKYTGKFYSNYSMGTSFSLGYVGDFYIDYGCFLMFLMLFLWGIIVGKIFKNLFEGAANNVLAIGIMSMSFLILYKFEISMLKLVGNVVVFWIFYRIMEIFVFPRVVKYYQENE